MNTKKTNLFCSVYGHNYIHLSHANENTPKLICKCCKSYFDFKSDGTITPVILEKTQEQVSLIYMKITA
ncbi:hypothetical protein [Thalassobellus citreus]|uniref:hypothetical protein n=1 Tax=Thalassobellus citreus TaxID=3367752 RepID=UPI00378CFF80